MAFKQIIIVEGRSDTENLQRVFGDIKTIETGGSNINSGVLKRIKNLKNEDLIVFTDPDFQGERIRKIIQEIKPDIKHAFLKKTEAQPHNKGTLGIEHASAVALKEALDNVLTPIQNNEQITMVDLRKLKLIDDVGSAHLRSDISDALHLGEVNGKQFLKRLNLFNISKEQLRKSVEDNG